MSRHLLLAVFILTSILPASAKKRPQPPDPAWAGITARGRMLAEYDAAIITASRELKGKHTANDRGSLYLARKTDAGWVVAYGRRSDSGDKFLIADWATPGANPQELSVTHNEPPQEDTGFFLFAARALELSWKNFQVQPRPYHYAVLPADSGQMYTYIYPAPTRPGIYPLGGDVRFLISSDGSTIIEKRLLHKTILEIDPTRIPPGAQWSGGAHSHVLTDTPEDTDVFYVLTRKPAGPEYIGTRQGVFAVETDGTIQQVK